MFGLEAKKLIDKKMWNGKSHGKTMKAGKLKVHHHLLFIFINQSILPSLSLSFSSILSRSHHQKRNIFDLRCFFSHTWLSASAVSSNEIEMALAPEWCPFYFIFFWIISRLLLVLNYKHSVSLSLFFLCVWVNFFFILPLVLHKMYFIWIHAPN